jgi:protein gp37
MTATDIEWADAVWNPVTGCTPISPGCANCYARRMANRLRGRCGYPSDDPFRVTLHPDRLDKPLHWRKPRRVFVNSMGDLFHEDTPDDFIAAVFGVMLFCQQHTFLILTKRPGRARAWFTAQHDFVTRTGAVTSPSYLCFESAKRRVGAVHAGVAHSWPPSNVYLGVTAEDQQRADERIPLLLQTPAAVRFVSVEPMLGHIHIGDWTKLDGELKRGEFLDWLICGAETGPGARPMNLEWARSLRDQCKAAGVPYFFKKAGPGIETPSDLNIREFPK